MMEKVIHFYEYCKCSPVYYSWNATQHQIINGESTIHTTQMGLLDTRLFDLGYRIFVHESEEEFYEIVLGGNNERTDKVIRPAHNLFNMWRAGAFKKH